MKLQELKEKINIFLKDEGNGLNKYDGEVESVYMENGCLAIIPKRRL